MATLLEADVQAQFQAAVKLYDRAKRFGSSTSPNLIGLQDALTATLKGDFQGALTQAVAATRSRLDGALRDAAGALDPVFRGYGQVIGATETDTQSIITRLYDYFTVTTPQCLLHRGFVFGAVAAVGTANSAANGVFLRLNVDAQGFVQENQNADTKVAECTGDASSGTEKWEETFTIRGGTAAIDLLQLGGSGHATTLAALSGRASNGILKNPSFSQYSPGNAPTAVTALDSWVSTSGLYTTTYNILTAAPSSVNGYYREFPGDATPYALRFLLSDTLTQTLEVNRSKFSATVPYVAQLVWRRKASATGTLTFALGSQSVAVSLASGTNDVWNVLRLPLGTGSWFTNFNQAGLRATLQVATLAVGQVDVDDVLVSPMAAFDGSWYAIVGTPATGLPVQWLRKDKYAWTDATYVNGVNQEWLWRTNGRYWPARPAAPTAPTAALAGAGAGNVDNGTHVYAVTTRDVNGVQSLVGAASAPVTVVDKTADGKVAVATIPTGPATITAARLIYRSKAGTATPLYLLTTLADNVTTTFTDNVADASLPATQPPAGTLFADPT